MSGEADEYRFGRWLRQKLAEHRLPLARLCREVGCDYTYLWRIMNAESANGRRYTRPSYALTRRVGEALHAPREALAAAGYGDQPDLSQARVADRMARLESGLAEMRALIDQPPATERSISPDWRPVRLPLLGQIQAGELREALANPEDYVEIPELIAAGGGFVLRVRGDSMSPTLLDGDWVVVREQSHAEPGQLVVAAVDGEVTLKRYLEEGEPLLAADNPQWQAVPLGPGASIQGVVTGSFRPPEVLRRRPR